MSDDRPYLTQRDIFNVHAEFGRLNKAAVKEGMGPNWPKEWDAIPEGEGMWEPDRPAPPVDAERVDEIREQYADEPCIDVVVEERAP